MMTDDTKDPPDNILDMIEIKKRRSKPKDKPPTSGPGSMPATHTQHFQVLGYDGDVFYFFSSGGKQIRALSSYKLGRKIELLTLAPLDWWEREYGGEDGFTARRVELAANQLIRQCYAKGVFSADSRRGRGVWVDAKDDQQRIVIHAGDRLYIDGAETPLLQGDTTHVYEQARAVSVSMDNPLSKAEAKDFLMFCRALSWECATYGYLLAGFVVVAIASGALRWRPHGLLNGPKGCGKSWVMDVLVHILGGFCLAATGGTSAAGLRQSLSSDALPVLFDEAEGDSGRAQDNIAAVLSLMRHSSAALEAKVFKGGADGKASASIVRSCFLLAAIRDPLIQAADKSRVTLFNLRASSAESAQHWKQKLVPMADRLMRNGYAERLRGRVFANIPSLLASIDVFSNACTETFGDRRMGDQIGAMLGGVWLLTEDGVPTEAEADRRVGMMKWEDQSELLRESSDERACLQAIMEAHVRVDGDDWHGEASIGELVKFIRTKIPSADLPIGLPARDAKRTLAMYGIRVEESGNVLVSNTNGMLARKVMAHTHWPQGWGKLLSRITGAQKRANPVEISGTKSRVTEVPGSELDGNSGDTDEQ
jgi:putative DNA primase/helicase